MKFTALLLSSALLATQANALNIVLTNDDGLTSNVEALYTALKAEGHDVIVSVPCYGQSGMGGAIKFLQPIPTLDEPCLNNAAPAGAAGVGHVTKEGDYADYFYVNGTPNMATAYGVDIAGQERWNAMPDLILSGPNEGQNVGAIVVSSGTVSNAQYALARGVPAIALSAGSNSKGETDEAGNHAHNPLSDVVAGQSVNLIDLLIEKNGEAEILPAGVALNVNFPDELTAETPFEFSEIGDYQNYLITFTDDLGAGPMAEAFHVSEIHEPGITIALNSDEPNAEQTDDESVVYKTAIAVSAMQNAYDAPKNVQDWLKAELAQ